MGRLVQTGDRHDHDRFRPASWMHVLALQCPVDRAVVPPDPEHQQTSSGMARTTIQAPDRNLLSMTMSAMTPVVTAPRPLIAIPRAQPCSRRRHQRTTMLGLGEGEGQEHAERVERDQRGDAGAEPDQQEGRQAGEGDDPGREREPLPAERELAWHEVVAGQERAEAREVGEGRVRREREDEMVAAWMRMKKTRRRREAGRSGKDRLFLAGSGRSRSSCHEADAQEQDREDRRRPDQGDPGVPPFRRLEGGDAVGDRLDAGQRRGAELNARRISRISAPGGRWPPVANPRAGYIGRGCPLPAAPARCRPCRGSRRCRGRSAP